MWVPVVWNEQLGCVLSSTLYLTNLLIIVFRQLEGRSLPENLCRYAQPRQEIRFLVSVSHLDNMMTLAFDAESVSRGRQSP